FKKNHSTTTAITEATNCIVGDLNMEKPANRTIMTCLDMKAAFDTISVAKLLCLAPTERRSATEGRAITKPLQFLRDVPTIPDTRIITYADDMTLLVQDPLLKKADKKSQDALDSLQRWFKDKQLDISADKSTVTIFTADTKEFKYDPGLKWEGSVIPMQNKTRLFGVELDTLLKMNGY
uniref:Reverse transcriptase domain-containing protein n=2 Tax=Caenorhabditis japonica TaxID=281687 RepID=A0A8R1IET3_CAEJA